MTVVVAGTVRLPPENLEAFRPHMATWRSHWPEFGVSDRRLFAYETASERPL